MPRASGYPLDMFTRIAAVAVLLLPCLAFAWGGDGHQIVALIAEERLKPATKAAIHGLLGADANISDAEVCNWADQIKRERRNTAPWHYVDIPTTQPSYAAARDGRDGANVIDAIERFETVLADKSKPKEERAEALKFIVHFVGDVHQPLHCADRNGDHGGNGRLVFFLGRRRAVNLHMVWDSQILIRRKGTTRILDYALALNAKISDLQAAEWQKGTPVNWANESHDVAVAVAYKDVPEDGDPPKLDQAYVDRAVAVIDEQLKRGGVRLAGVLNRCLGK